MLPSNLVLAVAVSVHYCGPMYHGAAYLFHKFFIIDSVHVECKSTILFVILARCSSMQTVCIHERRMYIQCYRAAVQVTITRSTIVSVYSNVLQR
jgi:hypothetical protein